MKLHDGDVIIIDYRTKREDENDMNPRCVRYDVLDLLLHEALGMIMGRTMDVAENVGGDRNDGGDDGKEMHLKHTHLVGQFEQSSMMPNQTVILEIVLSRNMSVTFYYQQKKIN